MSVKTEPSHPAKFSPTILAAAAERITLEAEQKQVVVGELLLLDPFAGTGLCHTMPCSTRGVEIEPDWARADPRTRVGDATNMAFFADDCFDVIFTSPVYGNRMSDHHNARDASKRHSYTHDIGHPLADGNAGAMYFANDQPPHAPYRQLHRAAWAEVARVHKPGGLFMLNVSNFVHDDVEHLVAQWHVARLVELGYRVESAREIGTPRMKFGANRERADHEYLVMLRAAPL